MIAIIDYGMGNLRSVSGAVKKVGFEPVITNKARDLEGAEKLILPGVGAFGDAMKNMRALGLVEQLETFVINGGKPILGICLGSQLMAKESFEFGRHEGLGWIDGSVVKLDVEKAGLRIPHVGWNGLKRQREDLLFEGVPEDALFYYVHSFHIECREQEAVVGRCDYGIDFDAALHRGNIYATQFHPEKSQLAGLRVLKNFLEKG